MKSFMIIFALFIINIICFSQNPKPGEGFIHVEGGRIWYKVVGEGPGIPLMIVHGGPGSRSCGSIPVYSRMGNERPLIFFDQLESGFSDRPGDTSLWKLPYFVKQVEAIKDSLYLDKFHLLGSSWGGAIVIEYMLSTNAKEVTSVIFSGPLLSTPVWMEDAKILLSQLPQPVRDTISKYEDLEQYYHPAYLAATDSFYARYLVRNPLPPTPDVCDGSRSSNIEIYEYMWGPTEFNATGTLKDFDRTHRLHELKLPVLFVAGEYDEVREETLYEFQKEVKSSQVAIIPDAGHAKTVDNPDEYIRILSEFMNIIETKKD